MTRTNSALNYPPYLEAIAAERLSRDAAMLGVRESIAGFEVVPMTLWHLLVLRIMRHPLLIEQEPSPEQLAQFLWLLHPDFSPGNKKGRKRLVKACRNRFYPPRYLALFNTRRARMRHDSKKLNRLAEAAKVVQSAKAFLKEALQDRPAMQSANGFQPDYYSDGIAFCARFARELHFSEEQVMHMPLKRLFQYLNEMKVANGSKIPLCNPSDAVKAEFYRDLNQRLSSEREARNLKLRELTAAKLREVSVNENAKKKRK